MIFAANWMIRGFRNVLLITPNELAVEIALEGLAKFAKLRMLKNSARNSKLRESLIGVSLMSEASIFRCSGPRRVLRPALPKRFPAGTKATVLKYLFSRSSVLPESRPVATEAPVAKLAALVVTP